MEAIKKHLPNALTLFRLVCIPFFVLFMEFGGEVFSALAASLFLVAAITDYFDGLLARKWDQVSDFGKLFDPLADKLLVMAALIMLIGYRSDISGSELIPAWLVFLLLAREVWVTGLRGIAAERGLVIPAGVAGKLKSFFQMFGICLLLFPRIEFELLGRIMNTDYIAVNFIWTSLILSYWGAIDYTSRVFFSDKSSEVAR